MTIVYPFKALSLLVLFLLWGGDSSAMDDREFLEHPPPNGMLRSANHTTSNHRRLALSVDQGGNVGITYTNIQLGQYTSFSDNANIFVFQYTMPSSQAFTVTLTASNSKLYLTYKLGSSPPTDLSDRTSAINTGSSTSGTLTGAGTGANLYVVVSGYGTSGVTNGRLLVSTSPSTPFPTVAPTPMPTKRPTQLPTACGPSPDCGLASKVWNYFLGGR